MADNTSDVKEAVRENARKERDQIVRSGGRDPGQEKMERVWRENFEKNERKQEQRKRR